MKAALRRAVVIAIAAALLMVFSGSADAAQKYRVGINVGFGGVIMAGAALVVWGVSVAYSANARQDDDDRIKIDDERHALVQTKKEPDGIEIRLVDIKF